MTTISVEVVSPRVHITGMGKVSIECDTRAVSVEVEARRHDATLIRALYEASRDWLVLNGEIDAPKEQAA